MGELGQLEGSYVRRLDCGLYRWVLTSGEEQPGKGPYADPGTWLFSCRLGLPPGARCAERVEGYSAPRGAYGAVPAPDRPYRAEQRTWSVFLTLTHPENPWSLNPVPAASRARTAAHPLPLPSVRPLGLSGHRQLVGDGSSCTHSALSAPALHFPASQTPRCRLWPMSYGAQLSLPSLPLRLPCRWVTARAPGSSLCYFCSGWLSLMPQGSVSFAGQPWKVPQPGPPSL